MKYTSPIDPHVHLRWTEYADERFTYQGLEDAHAVGLAAVMEMGNTTPPITDAKVLGDRCLELDSARDMLASLHGRPAAHYVHLGLTDRMLQLVEVFTLLRHGHPRAVAAKAYTCHSTGNMGLLTERAQRNVWHMAAETGWEGPIIVHAEDPTAFGKPALAEFDALKHLIPPEDRALALEGFLPDVCASHSLYQHEEAEVLAAVQQVRYAREAQFTGILVFAHVSSPDTVDAVLDEWTDADRFTVAFEVTWHHLFLNAEEDYPLHGNRVKMNPPLRRQASQERLLNLLLDGTIHFIGSDHAPHPVARKDGDAPPSGIPALPFWPRGIELLRRERIGEDTLRAVTYGNAAWVFGLADVAASEVEVAYDPGWWERYGWNPFSRLG